ncbi:MAG TPA: pitrilysin family protein [Oligoflexia bacterium]|nr:pitrilysin family protein [Oligoflexia bacterium]HMP27723.1 pitrilysin family protein [Oligoflexia bacterium]
MAESLILNNGLRVVLDYCPELLGVTLAFIVANGSRDEKQNESGVSHFLEHIFFKSNQFCDGEKLMMSFADLGAKVNAFTSDDSTCYHITVLPENLTSGLKLLVQMFSPKFLADEFETEKRVILEEIARHNDQPSSVFFEDALTSFFSPHPAGNSVLGTTETVAAMTPKMMRDYFKRRYCAKNIIFVVAGQFNRDDVVCQLSNFQIGFDNGASFVERKKLSFAGKVESKIMTRAAINQAHILLISDAPNATSPSRYSLALLGVILGDAIGSRGYWQLLVPAIAEGFSAGFDAKEDCGMFYLYATTSPANRQQTLKIMREIIDKADDLKQEELERARAKVITGLILGQESSYGRCLRAGYEWFYRGRLVSLQDEITAYERLTLVDIKNAISQSGWDRWSEYQLVPKTD